MSRTLVLIAAIATTLTVAACGGQTPAPSVSPTTSAAAEQTTSSPPTLTRTSSTQTETETETVTQPATTVVAVDPSTFEDGNGISWTSPSGNIACRISSLEYGSGCQAADAPVPPGASCTNPTFTVDQLTKGFFMKQSTIEPACFNQGVFYSPTPKVLQYNQSIAMNSYTCVSREDGMTCTNDDGFGFQLSAQVARLF
jgi:ABC-type transport system substrate-binding protein